MVTTTGEKPAAVTLSNTNNDLSSTKLDKLAVFDDPDAVLSEVDH